MLDIAATKFRPGEAVEFRTADATALPFADASFDAVVCQFGVMFFPESLIDAGFAGISVTVLKSQKEVADFATLARGLVYGSPIIDQVMQRGGVEAERIVAAIVREYRKEFGSDPATIPLQAIVFSAEKPA